MQYFHTQTHTSLSKKRIKKAYTLVEILIVVAVIGIIAGFIIPWVVQYVNGIGYKRSAEITLKKVEEALMQMKTEGKLTGYTTADEFVDEFQNYVKVMKRCTSSNLTECFPATFKIADGSETVTTSSLTTGDTITNGTLQTATTGKANVGLVLLNGVSMIINYDPTCSNDSIYDNRDKGTGCLVMLYDVNGSKAPNQISSTGVTSSTTTLESTLGSGTSSMKDIYLLNAAIATCDGYKIGSLCVAAADESSTTNVASSQAVFDSIVSRYGFNASQGYGISNNYWIGAIAVCEAKGMRLPTISELGNMYTNACGVAVGTTCSTTATRTAKGFSALYYWSSTEYSAYTAKYLNFSSGAESYNQKSNTRPVRCVR